MIFFFTFEGIKLLGNDDPDVGLRIKTITTFEFIHKRFEMLQKMTTPICVVLFKECSTHFCNIATHKAKT